jgi:NAD(P)-dependent dehydrogenase (short-subunit alcohol dehydrogenase family)
MKRVLITGATTGIGKATVLALAKINFEVIFIARNPGKAESLKQELINSCSNRNINYIIADLASKRQLREAVTLIRNTYDRLDILINNAGVCLPVRRITEDGLEETFQINHLSYFILAISMIDLLAKSDDARIINMSSGGHKSAVFDPDNFQSEKYFSPFETYCNTKLMNILFTQELAERLRDRGITVNAVHPGVVNTAFGAEFKGIYRIMSGIIKPFLLSPEKGARTTIFLATSDTVKGITGKYWSKQKIEEPDNYAINEYNRRLLWERSEILSAM